MTKLPVFRAAIMAVGAAAMITGGTAASGHSPPTTSWLGSTAGNELVFTQLSGTEPHTDPVLTIYSARTDGHGVRRLTTPCVDCSSQPAWSPDGLRIAYYGYGADWVGGVFVMNRDGSGKRRVSTACDEPTWSPDGTRIGCDLAGPGGGIGIVSLRTGSVTRVPHIPQGVRPDWAPDGKHFAFEIHWTPWRDGVYLADVDGTHFRMFKPDRWHPRWSPDGTTLLVVRGDNSGIELIRLRDSKTTRFIDAETVSSASWSPDGTKIAYAANDGLHILDLVSDVDRKIALRPDVCRTGCTDVDWGPDVIPRSR